VTWAWLRRGAWHGVRAVAASVVLAALTGGVPAALARYIGWPLPRHLSGPQLRALLAAPLTDAALIKVLACVVWAAWALFALCAAAEVAARVGGRPCPRVPVISGVQAVAAALVGAITLAAPASAASTGALLRAAAPAAAMAPHLPGWAPPVGRPAQAAGPRPGQDAADPLHMRARPVAGASAPAGPHRLVYRVKEGDNLWDIAARHLGDGERWHEIFTLNRGRPQPGGGALSDPSLIYPRWFLLLPAGAAGHGHTAGPGRQLSRGHIRQQRGAGDRPSPRPGNHHLAQGHHGRRAGRPGRPPLPVTPGRGRPVGIHLPGGGLAGITLAAAISAALVAWRLHRRRTAALCWPADSERAETLPDAVTRLRRAYLQSMAASDAEARGEPWPGEDDPGALGLGGLGEAGDNGEGLDEFGAPAGPAARWPAGPAGPAAGLLPAPVPPAGPPRSWGRPGPAAPDGPGSTRVGWAPGPPPGVPLPAGTVAFGTGEGAEIPLPAVTRRGLGLTGPGAAGTARALLIGLLAAATPGHNGLGVQVVIPETDARQLTGNHPPAPIPGVAPGLPDGLIITPGLAGALDHIETQITHRLRLLDTSDGELRAPGMPGIGGMPVPPLALIASVDLVSARRVQAVVEAGARAGVVVIVLGDWPAGTTCQISADGTIVAATSAGLAGAVAFHLPAPDTAAMLGLLRGAQGHITTGTPRTPGEDCGYEPGTAGQPHNHPDDALGGGHSGPGTARLQPAGQPCAASPQPRPHATPPTGGHPATPSGGTQARPPETTPVPHPAATRPVHITVLGPLRITVAGREIRGGLRKARELLACLAVHPEGMTGEGISADLWPESSPRYAASQRKLALRRAREMLRTATGLPAPLFIILAGDRYRFDSALIEVDLWQFDAALGRAQAASGQDQLTALRQATGLYQGPLADGAGYEWAERYAEPARRRAVDALARIAGILQPGDPEHALTVLEAALEHDPYNEAVYQEIMHIQARLGRPGAARRTLALLEARLAGLGLSPAPATRQAAEIPPGDPSAAPCLPRPGPGRQENPARPQGRPRGSDGVQPARPSREL
jgi:DNA-binding SARP family transcriptional activator